MADHYNTEEQYSYVKKVWVTVGIVVLTLICLGLVGATFNVFLLIFAGILIAVFFRGLSGLIERKTKWKEDICVYISILSTLVFVAGFFWLIGAQIQTQVEELSDTIPKTFEKLREQLEGNKFGDRVIESATSKDTSDKLQTFAGKFFTSTFGVFGDLYVVLFIGLFITVSPKTYINGVVVLVPESGQKKAREIFKNLGEQLRKWIKGKLLSMFVVFVMTAIGLAILGMPLWLVLALTAGLLSFVPNFGPILALIPAVLVALMQSPQTAMYVAGLYILIQFIESNFITTLIQKKMIDMPPALIISAQMVLGALTGSWGLLLSTPLTAVLIVIIQQLYLKSEIKKQVRVNC